MGADRPVDVLVVGAGPTGLTLAAQLRSFGTRVRVIDRKDGPVRESRALAIQPRTLEVLHALGVARAMVERGRPAVRLAVYSGRRTVTAPLFDLGLDDTAYPFLLFLSQAETETILGDHLTDVGLTIERGVELVDLASAPGGVTCTLRHLTDGRTERVAASYVVGCDGPASRVRDRAGIAFTGAAYPQTFVLADLDVDGLEPDVVHAFASPVGMLFLFPLGRPAPWRLLAMVPDASSDVVSRPQLRDLQALADAHTSQALRLREPVWSSYFRIHHRHAARYRDGRVFLAGDAAHVHSPAGAQGMNTGIQDATNLGWKLAHVTSGHADPALLDTYDAERRPVGRSVLRATHRAATIATSSNPLVRRARTHLAPRLIGLALRSRRGRARWFRTLSQLAIDYRHSPVSVDGHPAIRRGPRAGDRLPDAPVTVDGTPGRLHDILTTPAFHLLLSGPPDTWPPAESLLDRRHTGLVRIHRLTTEPRPDALVDTDGHAHRRLGLRPNGGPAHHLVRPDGHIAYCAAGPDLTRLLAYLDTSLDRDHRATRVQVEPPQNDPA
jgi:2-polyprenyl-6-methoxyphenol hydroxylase-like FAD-dependent oxidoreductase